MSTIEERGRLWTAVDDRVRQAAQRGGQLYMEQTIQTIEIDTAQGRFESPIEAIFAAWWTALRVTEGMEWADLMPQVDVEVSGIKYRPDFTVVMDMHPGYLGSQVFTPYPNIAIELDGHEFHERTKEQVTYRNQRDRALQGAGWQVLHVSGSELYRTPEESVMGIMSIVRRAWAGFWSAYRDDVNRRRTT